MRNYFKPAFILGLVSNLVLFLGIALKSYEYKYANYIIFGSFFLGAIYWIWSIILVINDKNLQGFQKSFWSIIVVSVPMIGGFIYQIMQQTKNRTVS
ncbi:MAG: hypothetical protein ACXWV5_02470 [Flavitalea sp.]